MKRTPAQSETQGAARFRAVARPTAAVLTLALGLGAQAAAADPAVAGNPWASARIGLVSSGTGHGTSGQTFVNAANGFHPGDNSPDDGVVSSGDSVVYEVSMEFAASTARTVTMTLDVPSHLVWRTANDMWCRSGHFVRAARVGNTCSWQVPAGAVEQIGPVPMVFEARDSGGDAIGDQVVSISTGLAGPVFAISAAEPVTVVSAPAADVYVTFNQTYEASRIIGMRSVDWSAGPASGHFWLTPLRLSYPGFHPTKGASALGPWWGTFDVSAFPAGTAWALTGYGPLYPDAGGLLTLPARTGPMQITYTVPGWGASVDGVCTDYEIDPVTGAVGQGCWAANATHDFPVRVNVHPDSFATGVFANNAGPGGAGWQPGDGQGPDYSTADAGRGSRAGQPFANNDWSAARVVRRWTPPPPTGLLPVAHKEILAPTDTSATVWQDRNITADAGAGLANRSCLSASCLGAAPGTEVTSVVSAGTGPMLVSGSRFYLDHLVFADTFNPREQQAAPDGQVGMNAALRAVADGGAYWVQWHPQARTAAQVGDLADEGWVAGWPQGEDVEEAATIRLVVAAGEVPFEANTRFEAHFPLRIRSAGELAAYAAELGLAGPDQAFDGRNVVNTGLVSAVDDAGRRADTMFPRGILIRLERPGSVTLTHTTPSAQVPVGDPVAFTVQPAVAGLAHTGETVTGQVVIELDRCLVGISGTANPAWDYQIIAAIPGPSGRVCGDPESTPAQIVLTSRAPITPTWTNRGRGEGTLPAFTYRATASLASPVGAAMTSGATVTLDGFDLPATAAVSVATLTRAINAARLAADLVAQEVDAPISWTWDVYTNSPALADGGSQTVLVLPHLGDGALWNPNLYDEAQCGDVRASAFSGTYTLAGAVLSLEDSPPGTTLWWTDSPITGPAMPGALWHEATGGTYPGATALKIDVAAGATTTTASVNLTLQPAGNRRGDVYVAWASPTALTGTLHDIGVAEISAGNAHTLALATDGTVWSWGAGADGRLGNGGGGNQTRPVRVETAPGVPLSGVQAVSAGGNHSLALRGDGTVWAWGLGSAGQLGNGATAQQTRPVRVETAPGVAFSSVRAISAGGSHSLAVLEDGTVWVWGLGSAGQLGNGSHSNQSRPVRVETAPGLPLTGVQALTAGGSHSLAVLEDGTVWAWGDGANGQLGNAVAANQTRPVRVETAPGTPLTGVQALSAGRNHSLALLDDGTVRAWGWGAFGQLGNGATGNQFRPVRVETAPGTPLTGVQTISAGGNHSLAVLASGEAWAWGEGAEGRLGDGGNVNRNRPVLTAITATMISAGGAHSMAVTPAGELIGWGANANGQLGDGTSTTPVPGEQVTVTETTRTGLTQREAPASGTAPIRYVEQYSSGVFGTFMPDDFVQVAAGEHFSLALMASGEVWAWGTGEDGRLGNGESSVQSLPVRVEIAAGVPLTDVQDIATGYRHSLALLSDGTLWAWGAGANGQLGNGATANRGRPVQVETAPGMPLAGVQAISAGQSHSLAVLDDGTVWAWGSGLNGRLGNGATGTQLRPVRAETPPGVPLTGAVSVSAGQFHSLALLDDGTVWAWGTGNAGQLGNGATTEQMRPVRVETAQGVPLTGVQEISAGSNFSLALLDTGEVWAWGHGGNGRLGTGDTTVTNTRPLRVETGPGVPLTGVQAASAGRSHSLAVLTDGTVRAWGEGSGGRLGTGRTTDELRPVPVETALGVPFAGMRGVSAGFSHSLAVSDSGGIWALGGAQHRPTPITMHVGATLTGVRQVAASNDISTAVAAGHLMVLLDDGTVRAWGANGSGQLGNGNSFFQTRPVRVETAMGVPLSGVAAVAAGIAHSLALMDTGEVWAWGAGGSGQLGNGATTTTHSRPVRVETAPGVPLAGVTAIAAGANFSLALLDSGEVWAWGSGLNGRLGNGATGNQARPVRVETAPSVPLNGVHTLAAGVSHSLAVLEDGTVWAWGNGGSGQLGSGVMVTNQLRPVRVETAPGVPLTGARGIAGGAQHSLAVLDNGEVWAWGGWSSGQLGSGATTHQTRPVRAETAPGVPLTGVQAVSAGIFHSLAVRDDGTVWAWGSGDHGRLGTGATTDQVRPVQLETAPGVPLTGVQTVAAGWNYALAVRADGIWVWGSNADGRLGVRTAEPHRSLRPVPMAGPTHEAMVAARAAQRDLFTGITSVSNVGTAVQAGIGADGRLLTWATSTSAVSTQLGTSSFDFLTPNDVTPPGVAFTATAGGTSHGLALTTTGEVWAWGTNNAGQVGDGTSTSRGTPVLIPAARFAAPVTAVFAAGNYSAALAGGELYSWGADAHTSDWRVLPGMNLRTPIALDRYTHIGYSANHRLLLDEEGRLWGNGTNTSGRLANGSATNIAETNGLVAIQPTRRFDFLAVDNLNNQTLLREVGSDRIERHGARFGSATFHHHTPAQRVEYAAAVTFTGGRTATVQVWRDRYLDAALRVPAPCPAPIHILASTIKGTTWWDRDGDGRQGPGEPGIGGVEVTLHRATGDGQLGALVATTLTDDTGGYLFDHLPSGRYVSVVHRGDTIPATVLSYYNQQLDVATTYSWQGRLGPLSGEVSAVIALGVDQTVPAVDFGFHKPNPGVALDKSEASVTCEAGWCEATWDITVTNIGTAPLGNVVLNDVLPADAVDVRVTRGHSALVAASTTTVNNWTTRSFDLGALRGDPASVFHCEGGARIASGGEFAPVLADEAGWELGGGCLIVPGPDAGQVVVQVSATFAQPMSPDGVAPAADRVVVNQAWVDSPLTPFAGLHGQGAPDAPIVPDPSDFDARGVPGNPTCNTDATSQLPEDSCDQVPALIPASHLVPGSISGVVWWDENGDGMRTADEEQRIAGATVTLLGGPDGWTVFGRTTTCEQGRYTFEHLPPGQYRVQFGVSHLDTPVGGSWAISPVGDSKADQGGLSGPITLTSGQHVGDIDLGVFVVASGVSITKGSAYDIDSQAILAPDADGYSQPVTVTVTITNTGEDDLVDIEWADETTSGPAIADWDCYPAVTATLVLAPGGTIVCEGVLPAMARRTTHANTATVMARGAVTGRLVGSIAEWEASVLAPGLGAVKEAFWIEDVAGSRLVPIPSGGTWPGRTPADVIWRYTITNTGDLPVTGLTGEDIANGTQLLELVQCDEHRNSCQPQQPFTLQPSQRAWLWSVPEPRSPADLGTSSE